MTSLKTRRSYNIPNHAHFLTFSCYKRLPLFDSDISCQWLIDSLRVVRDTQQVSLIAYVIMPEHVHLLIHPRTESYQISRILAAIKRPVSKLARAWYTQHDPKMMNTLRVEQGDRVNFRFWQAGGGYDRNITDRDSIRQIADYIHGNPVRRGLAQQPTDWDWSSARYWAGERDVQLVMDRVAL